MFISTEKSCWTTRMSIAMSSVDLTAEDSMAVWQQFGDWLDQSAHNYRVVHQVAHYLVDI